MDFPYAGVWMSFLQTKVLIRRRLVDRRHFPDDECDPGSPHTCDPCFRSRHVRAHGSDGRFRCSDDDGWRLEVQWEHHERSVEDHLRTVAAWPGDVTWRKT